MVLRFSLILFYICLNWPHLPNLLFMSFNCDHIFGFSRIVYIFFLKVAPQFEEISLQFFLLLLFFILAFSYYFVYRIYNIYLLWPITLPIIFKFQIQSNKQKVLNYKLCGFLSVVKGMLFCINNARGIQRKP